MIIRHKFRNKVYRVFNYRSRRWRGETQDPTDRGKAIKIPMTTGRLIDLDTTIHESLHACFWDMSEEAVDQAAGSISRFLWRLGWRKIM